MSKKGKVKMGLGDFLGAQATAASQPVRGRILPSGPDPNRDPDERRGGGGRRYDDDYDAPGSRSEGADTWRRGPGGGGMGMGMGERRGGGYDHERGGMAPEEGTWRSRAPPPRAGGGGYGDRYGERDGGRVGSGGYDDRRKGRDGGGYDAPPPTERKRLQLQSRTAPPPLPPMSPKKSEKLTPAPSPKPSGPRSNPFGAAQAVDTTQRDREIEAKLEAERQASFRGRDETFLSSDKHAIATGDSNPEEAGISADGVDGEVERKADVDDDGRDEAKPEVNGKEANVESTAPKIEVAERGSEKPAPPKAVGRWAALRREGGGDDRPSHSVGGFSRRGREDDRRGGGYGRDDRSSFGRKSDGDVGPGGGGFTSSRMGREPLQPPAPPAGNAFAKRFGSNFDRDLDRTYARPSGGMRGGGFERREDDQRVGMGGGFDRREDGRGVGMGGSGGSGGSGGAYDRRGDDRRFGGGFDRRNDYRGGGGGGMGVGPSRFNRDSDTDYQRRPDPSSPLERPPPSGRLSGGSAESSSPARSFSQMSIKETEEAKPLPTPVPKPEITPIPKPEPKPESKPEPEPETEPEPEPQEDPAEVSRASAKEALATGKRGTELKEFVLAQEKRTTAGALLAAALQDIATPQDMKWAQQEEFGAALVALSADNTEEQVGIINAVVAKCHEMGFPKETGGAVVQTIFMGMFTCDLCGEEAFIEWKDDVDSTAEGRLKAVMQTTPWFIWLEYVDEEEDED